MAYTIDEIRNSLPKIGDQRHGGTVDYVNSENLWYRVRDKFGTTETYKLPRAYSNTPGPKQRLIERTIKQEPRTPVYTYRIKETGKLYNSFSEIAKELGCSKETVRGAYRRGGKVRKQWTIEKIKKEKTNG